MSTSQHGYFTSKFEHLSEIALSRENVFICFQRLHGLPLDYTILVTSNGLERLTIRAESLPAQVIDSILVEHDQPTDKESSSLLKGINEEKRILQDMSLISRLSSDELLLATKWLSVDVHTAKTSKSVHLTVLKLKGDADVNQVPSMHVYSEVDCF